MPDATTRSRILSWSDDKRRIIRTLTASQTTLRILVKNKDDFSMLAKWYAHHAKIVPPGSITIFDNESTDPDRDAFYAGLPAETLVIGVRGLHNGLHTTTDYPELYAALAKSCRYFLFIDCDEHLCHYDGEKLRMDETIVAPLRGTDVDAIPTTRLDNYPGVADRYPVSEAELKNGTYWGKPILRGSFVPIGHINHNCQIPAAHYADDYEAGYVLLHHNRLDTRQRIKANLRKLQQRNFSPDGAVFADALAADPSAISDSATRQYVSEVQTLHETPYEDEEHPLRKKHANSGMMVVGGPEQVPGFVGDGTQGLLAAHTATPDAQLALLRQSRPGPKASAYARRGLTHDPHMTASEGALFANYLHRKSFLLEFGSGGSTVLAGAMKIPKVVSVDSSQDWLDSLSAAPELQDCDFTTRHVDIGPLAKWGNPADTSKAWNWPTYYTGIWDELGDRMPDIVLVDGRFRVACVLQTLLICEPSPVIVVHDFWQRDSYHCILAHLDTIASCDQLGVFRRRKDIDWRRLAIDLSRHSLDYS